MGRLRSTDWTAIKWYMKENNLSIKDLMVWPFVRFRDRHNQIVDINISNIKSKYSSRTKDKKKSGA